MQISSWSLTVPNSSTKMNRTGHTAIRDRSAVGQNGHALFDVERQIQAAREIVPRPEWNQSETNTTRICSDAVNDFVECSIPAGSDGRTTSDGPTTGSASSA